MIQDTFENAGLYSRCCENLNRAVELARTLAHDTPNGRIEIDGETMFGIVNTYTTRSPEDVSFEAHRKCIDVQILLSGQERIDVTQSTDLPVLQPYDEDTDVMFYASPQTCVSVPLKPGEFIVLFPHDVHRPGLSMDAPSNVQKLVIKIHI